MNKAKTTPGPWSAVPPLWTAPQFTRFVIDADRHLIARVDFANAHQSENEAIANAELIAAAPGFLAAAEAMIEAHDREAVASNFPKCGCEHCARFRAAIAQANGAPA